jgi:hypothetical protein
VNASIDLLIADFQTTDCLAPSGVNTEAGYYQHYYDGDTPTCYLAYVYYCHMEKDSVDVESFTDRLYHRCEYYAMAKWTTNTLDCNQPTNANACGTRLSWVRIIHFSYF